MKRLLALVTAAALGWMVVAAAQGELTPALPEGYVSVSEIVELPEFIPGVGALYIHPDDAPVGPWLSYGSGGELIEVLFMVPLAELQDATDWTNLASGTLSELGAGPVNHVDVTYNGGHPGMAEPHYHIRLVLADEQTQQAALSP